MHSEDETEYILAVDHGTSGVKTALVSIYGEVLGWKFRKTPINLAKGGKAEQDPQQWWNAFLETASTLVKKDIVPREKIGAVCVSSQWSVTVPVDRKGNHLMNAISWMDTRGAPYVKKKMGGPIKISGYSLFKILKWIPKTGGGPGLAGKGPVGHILFLKNEKPDIYQKTYKFLEAKDFMNLKLTGKIKATYDSNHLLWSCDIRDLGNVHYIDKLIKILGLDREKLPDMIKATDILGITTKEVTEKIGLVKPVKVIGGSPDLQMAAIGSGAVRDYQAHIYLGTSSWVITHVPMKKTDIFHNMASVPSANPKKYMLATEQESAGNCLTYLRDNFVFYYDEQDKPHKYNELDEIAVQAPAGSDNLIFTPWLYGERTPIEDHKIRGGFHNMSLEHNFDHAVRAVFEGVAYNSNWVLKYVEKFCGRKLDPINIIGGGAMSDVWCQIYADVMNRKIRRVKNPIQANARGAAFVASVGLGHIKFDDIPKYIEYSGIFRPKKDNVKVYKKLFKSFVELYHKNKKIYWKLNS